MATTPRRAPHDVASDLLEHPGRFSLFQVVRILQRIQALRAKERTTSTRDAPVGEDVRFVSNPSLGFPADDVARITETDRGYEVAVNAFGFFGPSGVLPLHYTELAIERQNKNDHAFREFLDMLTQRMTTLFCRAWDRTHVEIGYEKESSDPFTQRLLCLVGMGTGGLRDRMAVDDEVLPFYGGILARRPATAAGLRGMIEDYFALPVEVLSFQGRWMPISEDTQSCLTSSPSPEVNNVLGLNAVLGDAVWVPHSGYRLRIGPASLEQYTDFLPGSLGHRRLCDLTYFHAGQALEAELQLVVRGSERPSARLDAGDGENRTRLGWTSWLLSESAPQDDDQVVFVLSRS